MTGGSRASASDLPVPRGAEVVRGAARAGSSRPASSTCTCTCASRGRSTRRPSPPATAAAVAGGFTAVACMPNTEPINDHARRSPSSSSRRRPRRSSRASIRSAPCRSGREGEQLAEIGELEGRRLRRRLRRRPAGGDGAADAPGARVRGHARRADHRPLRGPVAEGRRRRARGLRRVASSGCAAFRARPRIMVERDISLAELTGAHVHVAHMSARRRCARCGPARTRGIARDRARSRRITSP